MRRNDLEHNMLFGPIQVDSIDYLLIDIWLITYLKSLHSLKICVPSAVFKIGNIFCQPCRTLIHYFNQIYGRNCSWRMNQGLRPPPSQDLGPVIRGFILIRVTWWIYLWTMPQWEKFPSYLTGWRSQQFISLPYIITYTWHMSFKT